jgi:hypothetical protein
VISRDLWLIINFMCWDRYIMFDLHIYLEYVVGLLLMWMSLFSRHRFYYHWTHDTQNSQNFNIIEWTFVNSCFKKIWATLMCIHPLIFHFFTCHFVVFRLFSPIFIFIFMDQLLQMTNLRNKKSIIHFQFFLQIQFSKITIFKKVNLPHHQE